MPIPIPGKEPSDDHHYASEGSLSRIFPGGSSVTVNSETVIENGEEVQNIEITIECTIDPRHIAGYERYGSMYMPMASRFCQRALEEWDEFEASLDEESAPAQPKDTNVPPSPRASTSAIQDESKNKP